MKFCTNCGSAIGNGARFCTSCGQPVSSTAAVPGNGPVPPPVQVQEPIAPPVPHAALEYAIQGDNLQIIQIRLKPGQELYAEAGRMIYKTPQVVWETRMSGETLGEKVWGAIKRRMMGQSLFLTYFHTATQGEIGFAGTYPGKIQSFELKAGQSVLIQRDSFLGSGVQHGVEYCVRQAAGNGIVRRRGIHSREADRPRRGVHSCRR